VSVSAVRAAPPQVAMAVAPQTAASPAAGAASAPAGAPRKSEAASAHAPLSSRLIIEIDAAAGRFVQTLIGEDQRVVRRYPDEGQLAFSRGVNAYLAAMMRR
jgi:hypothetical protein